MKAVLQKVKQASVHVDGKLVSNIGPGILALIGIGTEDTVEEIGPLVKKILSLKLWNEGMKVEDVITVAQKNTLSIPAGAQDDGDDDDPAHPSSSQPTTRKEEVWGGKPWKTSVVELGGEILCVSQFTLHARTTKGTKPDFHKSMSGPSALPLYRSFLCKVAESYSSDKVKDGAFGEMMDVALVNDGPVTIVLDTNEGRGA